MKILALNEWYNPVLQNLIYYFASFIGPHNFHWTGKRNYAKLFLPIHEIEESSHVQPPVALTNLQNGYYDYVIYVDQTTYMFLSSHLPEKGTKRVMIDSSDGNIIPRWYLENSELYFKSQLKKEDLMVSNKTDPKPKNISDEEQKRIFPFSLTPSFKALNSSFIEKRNMRKNYDVFFNGSAWPQKRVSLISEIKNHPEINFFGGLYNRTDLNFNNVIPDSIMFKAMSYDNFMMAISSSKICLNIEGNGKNCFRQFEILESEEFLLTQEHENFFGIKEPIDKKHAVFFKKDGSNLIDLIKYYLENEEERKEIAKNGKQFFEENCHPKVLAKYILDIMENNNE